MQPSCRYESRGFLWVNCVTLSFVCVVDFGSETAQSHFRSRGLVAGGFLEEEKLGGAEGDRTPDLMTASHALSQLSYGPVKRRCRLA